MPKLISDDPGFETKLFAVERLRERLLEWQRKAECGAIPDWRDWRDELEDLAAIEAAEDILSSAGFDFDPSRPRRSSIRSFREDHRLEKSAAGAYERKTHEEYRRHEN